MFDDLKARRPGKSSKESARLWASIAGATVLGAIAFKACSPSDGVIAPPPKPDAVARPNGATVVAQGEPLDRKPLARLVASPADPKSFDREALDYLITQIASGATRRAPDERLPLADVAGLDPAKAVGGLYETSGIVRSIDAEDFQSATNPAVDRLWGFSLEGDAGARIVVVQPGRSTLQDGGRPTEASRAGAAPEALTEGAEVRVRGYYLQRRVGSVGGVKSIEAPAAVLVAREYRVVRPLLTRIDKLEEADFSRSKDRSNLETRTLDEQPLYEVLSWSRRRGARAIADDLRSGAIPAAAWGTGRFQDWSKELKNDVDQSLPDPRTTTLAARGKVFFTTGALLTQDHEDWDTVPRNPYGVEERWKYWVISDHYGNAPLLFDCAFPLSEFEGVREAVAPPYQHVRIYGVFIKNYTYEPQKAHLRPDVKPDITVPFFVALRIEPITYARAPLWKNPFFLVGLSLAVFVAGFLLVMTRIEKKESTAIEAHRKRLRKKVILPGSGDRGSGATGSGATGGSAGAAVESAGDGSGGPPS